ncbi:putative centrosomal protein [Apostichopus japonicus]|uniref:Putative centrosomal protein n=1 Tax=Stichopus japonicus TaxID=307972 RepID=A0A2G8K6U7_STIJA|nr:putative centrosomal protein [Apostichopus japonicus]
MCLAPDYLTDNTILLHTELDLAALMMFYLLLLDLGMSPRESPTSHKRMKDLWGSANFKNASKLSTDPEPNSYSDLDKRRKSQGETSDSFKENSLPKSKKSAGQSSPAVVTFDNDGDNVSESGTYTIDSDNPSKDVMEARENIEEVFGIAKDETSDADTDKDVSDEEIAEQVVENKEPCFARLDQACPTLTTNLFFAEPENAKPEKYTSPSRRQQSSPRQNSSPSHAPESPSKGLRSRRLLPPTPGNKKRISDERSPPLSPEPKSEPYMTSSKRVDFHAQSGREDEKSENGAEEKVEVAFRAEPDSDEEELDTSEAFETRSNVEYVTPAPPTITNNNATVTSKKGRTSPSPKQAAGRWSRLSTPNKHKVTTEQEKAPPSKTVETKSSNFERNTFRTSSLPDKKSTTTKKKKEATTVAPVKPKQSVLQPRQTRSTLLRKSRFTGSSGNISDVSPASSMSDLSSSRASVSSVRKKSLPSFSRDKVSCSDSDVSIYTTRKQLKKGQKTAVGKTDAKPGSKEVSIGNRGRSNSAGEHSLKTPPPNNSKKKVKTPSSTGTSRNAVGARTRGMQSAQVT